MAHRRTSRWRLKNLKAIVPITDEGPGLPVTDLARAGEPFVRFEPSRNRATGGHGLGLAIAKATVERHGGTLILANRNDRRAGRLLSDCRLKAGNQVFFNCATNRWWPVSDVRSLIEISRTHCMVWSLAMAKFGPIADCPLVGALGGAIGPSNLQHKCSQLSFRLFRDIPLQDRVVMLVFTKVMTGAVA